MMLADEIIQNETIRTVLGEKGFTDLSMRIKMATRFVLDPGFVEATDSLDSGTREQLSRLIPFCKVPYERCWFEFSNRHRLSWIAMPHDDTRVALAPNRNITRVGYLFEPFGTKGDSVITLFWQILDSEISFSVFGHVFNDEEKRKLTEDIRHNRDNVSLYYIAPWANQMVAMMKKNNLFEGYCKETEGDWGGEYHFAIAMLALLNTKNVAAQNFVDKSELNLKRVRQNRLPLFSHYTLKISRHMTEQIKVASGQQIAKGGIRAHFVRGHWKQRKSGIFFWHPFPRGNRDIGIIKKDYLIKA